MAWIVQLIPSPSEKHPGDSFLAGLLFPPQPKTSLSNQLLLPWKKPDTSKPPDAGGKRKKKPPTDTQSKIYRYRYDHSLPHPKNPAKKNFLTWDRRKGKAS